MRKIKLAAVFLVLALLTGVVSCLFGCGEQPDPTVDTEKDYSDFTQKTYQPFLEERGDTVAIGTGVSTWKFKKSGNIWLFDGVYAKVGGQDEKVFTGAAGKVDDGGQLIEDGTFFTVLSTDSATGLDKQIDPEILQLTVIQNEADQKAIRLSGKGYVCTLTANSSSSFLERKFEFTVTDSVDVETGDMSFVLRSKVDEYTEYGYILSHPADEPQHEVPYSFPALAGKLTRESDSSVYTYMNVVDWYGTHDMLKTARRRKGLNDFFEQGILSSSGHMEGGKTYTLVEHICVRDGENDNFYDLIYDCRSEYGAINDLSLEDLILTNSNMTVYDWDTAAYHLTYDVLDARGRPLGDDMGTWGPYAYNNGGAQSFGSLNILKGLIRHAMATDNQELYDFALRYALQYVTPDPVYNRCYIMPLNSMPAYSQFTSDYFLFNSCFSTGEYTATDSWFPDELWFGSFKYYSRVMQFGEIALLTGNEQLKAGFLKLLPFVERLRGENFEQAVEWGLDEQPKLDFENGGSGGAAGMWANVMYVAAQFAETEAEYNKYMSYVQGAVDQANKQGFERSSALREYPKPECIGYTARMNLKVYEWTGDESYLQEALKTARGVYFYYFLNTHPSTYFQTLGYGYACARERWEAFMEMVETLSLLSPILEYSEDPYLYELYFTLRESALSTMGINGYPEGVLGGHSDWLDALFVPFEQPTAHQGDNPSYDGGGSSWNRHSKELYGSGEVFMGALMFSTFGQSNDPNVLLINYTANDTVLSRTGHKYRIYNAGAATTSTVRFPNFEEGRYEVTLDGESVGVFTADQLINGISMRLESCKPQKLSVTRTEKAAAATAAGSTVTLNLEDLRSDGLTAVFTAEGATHYELWVSRSEGFWLENTSIKRTDGRALAVGFEDSSTLWIKVLAFDGNGNLLGESQPQKIQSPDVEVGLLEDFGYGIPDAGMSVGGWKASSEVYQGTVQLITDVNVFINYPTDTQKFRAPSGYMAVYKPDFEGEDRDSFEKTFTVDLSQYPLFDFYPYTKNFMSEFSLQAVINGKTYVLMDRAQSFDQPSYRYDLASLSGAAGETEVKIIMISEGFNRGFAISMMRFVREVPFENYELTSLSWETAAEVDQTSGLVLTNPSELVGQTEFRLRGFEPEDYEVLEIVFDGMTPSLSGFVSAQLSLTGISSGEQVWQSTVRSLSANTPIRLNVGDIPFESGKDYLLKVTFVRGTVVIPEMRVKTIRLISDRLDEALEGFDAAKQMVPTISFENGQYLLTNGWKPNWAFANVSDGSIYNANPNVGYGSIQKTGIYVDLDVTPVISFTVSSVKGAATWALKCNDGSLATDLTLREGSGTGTFTANLRDAFGRGGTVNLTLDFYVLHQATEDLSVGVKFEGFAFLCGSTVYENNFEGAPVESLSQTFTLDTSKTDYLLVDIAELSYGSTWQIFLVDESGNEYELKTVYESAYGKMYFRGKVGAFKYQLSDILPDSLQRSEQVFRLKVLLDGKETSIAFSSIRLCNNNETVLAQQAAKIR